MRAPRALAAALLALGGAALGVASLSAPEARAGGNACAAREFLTVHEWGTFTSMQGSDGVALEGLHREEEALPAFVHDRSRLFGTAHDGLCGKGLEANVVNVTEKMETPVLYFYSKEPLSLDVRVCFQRGLLTQWYPRVATLGPSAGLADAGPLDMSKVERSFLEWRIDVLPQGETLAAVPVVGPEAPWALARVPDASLVSPRPLEGERARPAEAEGFIFYRGLGAFASPLQATTAPGAAVTLRNGGPEPVRHVFLLHVEGARARFTYAPEVPAEGAVTLSAPLDAAATSVDEMIASLRPALEARLVQSGLFAAEAAAMARTWERSYFRTEGLRALYVVPDRVVEAVLPLTITPAPREIVRVLVGRLECVTPESEREVAAALVDRASADEGKKAAAEARLARLGRFLEPHLRRILAVPAYEGAHAAAREALAGLGAPR